MKRRWMTIFLAFCLSLSLLPVWGRAEASTAAEPPAEDLFYQYMLQRAREERGELTLLSTGNETAGSRLTGQDAVLYKDLKKEIEKIAAGEESSTVFTLTYDRTAFSPGVSAGPWTLDELGAGTVDEGGNILFDRFFTFDLNALTCALLADCPYELYWYDKTSHVNINYYIGITARQTGNGKPKLYYGDTVTITLSMPVAFEYAEKEYNEDEGVWYYDQYTVSEEARTDYQVSAAVTAALGVVEANEDKSDLEKLTAYRDYICCQVTYNRAAAEDDDYPYGNPWQLIYVFDGNDKTDVVCEGYAKAFQYLCDLSDFENGVQCYSVSGLMVDEEGAEKHMWNIVHMPDGKNYLVDVTNVDEDSVGYPDKLFLKEASPENIEIMMEDGQMFTKPGYVVYVDGDPVSYVYDDNMVSVWGNEILTLAHTADRTGTMVAEDDTSSFTWSYYAGDRTVKAVGSGVSEDTPILVASYDEDHRMLEVAFLTDLTKEDSVTIPNTAASVRLFWLKGLSPRCSQGEIELAATENGA